MLFLATYIILKFIYIKKKLFWDFQLKCFFNCTDFDFFFYFIEKFWDFKSLCVKLFLMIECLKGFGIPDGLGFLWDQEIF